jgi:apolipoprotein N-acyltransferase
VTAPSGSAEVLSTTELPRGRRLRLPWPWSLVLAVAAGAAWALAAPPREWWWLVPLGAAALSVAVAGHGVRCRAAVGAVAGAVLYGTTLPWLTDFSVPGYVVVVVVETALLALALAAVPRWWALPAGLVLLEAVQTRFPLGGFPLPSLAHSQAGGPFVLAAPVGGALLVTGLAAAAGTALAAPVLLAGLRRVAVAGAAVLVVGGPLAAGAAVRTEDAGVLDAAVVQGGGPRGTRAVFTDPADVTARQLRVLDRISGSPDLVLLPEGVVVVDGPLADAPVNRELAQRARRLGTTLVVGVVEGEADGFRNAAVAYGPDGRGLGRYEKEHRVPFGEYIPGRRLLSRLSDATALVPSDAIVGRGVARLDAPAGRLGVVISYEIFFADRVREAVDAGGRVVLLPTNASSYVGEEVPAIEIAAARLRAREFGRAVLQAAPTGYSAIVLPDGRVLARGGLGEPALLRSSVPLRTGRTPYAAAGDVPVVAGALAVLLVAAAAELRSGRRWGTRRAAASRSTVTG